MRVPVTTLTNKPTKQSPRVLLSEPFHITPEEKQLPEICQTPVRNPIEPPLKLSVNSTNTITDDKSTPRYNLRLKNHVAIIFVIQKQHVFNLFINQETRKR